MFLQNIFYDQMEEKLSNRLTAALLKDCSLENIECSKYQLIFVTAEWVFSRSFLFWLKTTTTKKLPTVSLIGSTCVCFCRKTVLPVFNLIHFDWLPAHFKKCSDAQGVLLLNSLFGQASSRPSPARYPHHQL